MNTYLLWWNPRNFDWANDKPSYSTLREYISSGNASKAIRQWSCGNTRTIYPGDRVFILKTGEKDRAGIVASGYAITRVNEIPHYDRTRAVAGETICSIDVQFDKILDIDVDQKLSRIELQRIAPDYNWKPFRAGITIPEESAKLVEQEWERF